MTEYFKTDPVLFTIMFLIFLIIVILLFKKFNVYILQQNNPAPSKPKPQPILIEFIIQIYKTFKISIEMSFKIVLPGIVVYMVISHFGLCGAEKDFIDCLKSCVSELLSGNENDTEIVIHTNPDPTDLDTRPQLSASYMPDAPAKSKPNPTYLYDTDPHMSAFISGSLNSHQLEKLDEILEYERRNRISRIPMSDLVHFTMNNNDLLDAYSRWSQCKNLYRNTHHVVYPSERESVFRSML